MSYLVARFWAYEKDGHDWNFPVQTNYLHTLLSPYRSLTHNIKNGDKSNIESYTNNTLILDDSTSNEFLTVTLPGLCHTAQLTLNTTQILKKALSARAVYDYASSTGALFDDYGRECVEAFLSSVGFGYSAEVRTTAGQALGTVFDSICECSNESEGQ